MKKKSDNSAKDHENNALWAMWTDSFLKERRMNEADCLICIVKFLMKFPDMKVEIIIWDSWEMSKDQGSKPDKT